MRRITALLLLCVILIYLIPIPTLADENRSKIIPLDNGCYLKIEVLSIYMRESQRITGRKTYTYYSSSGIVCWQAILNGVFLYTGTNATCTGSSCDVNIINTDWYTVGKSSGMLGNKATAEVTMGQKVLGITVQKIPISMTLTCDANGNLS